MARLVTVCGKEVADGAKMVREVAWLDATDGEGKIMND